MHYLYILQQNVQRRRNYLFMEPTRGLEMLKQVSLYQSTALIHVVHSLEELQHGTVEKEECGILQTLMNAQLE